MTNLGLQDHRLNIGRRAAAIVGGMVILVFRVAAIMTLIAILLSQSRRALPTQQEIPLRRLSAAALVVESDPMGESRGHKPLFFDAGTGQAIFTSAMGPMNMFHASPSPWRDEYGRLQVVGVSNGLAPGASGEPELIRMSLPDGAILDRFPIANAPVARPCWFPDLSARILFIDSRGRLSRLNFDNVATGQATEKSGIISWREGIPGSDGMLMGDLSWPSDPRLGGRVLAILSPKLSSPDRVAYGSEEVWWLKLDRDHQEVVDAGRLIVPLYPASETPAMRCPVIGTGPDGRLLLAYMDRSDRDPWLRWRLRVVPVEIDSGNGDPIAQFEEVRSLNENCIVTRPAFSDDGRWISCIPWPEDKDVRRSRRSNLPLMLATGSEENTGILECWVSRPFRHELNSFGANSLR